MPRPNNYANCLIYCIVLCSLSIGYTQSLRFDFNEYSIVQGLSHNHVQTIAQDKYGFMWFGTADGLNRFDGYTFRKYKFSESDTTSLISNEIRTLLAEDDGTLLIGTNLGVCRYNPEKDNFKRYKINYTDDSQLHGNYVTAMRKRNDGSVWISYLGSGIDIIRPDTSFVLHYTMYRDDNYILRNDMITSIEFMPDGSTLLGGNEGLQVIAADKHVMTEPEVEKMFPWKKSIPPSYTCLYLSADNQILWVGTESGGAYKVNLKTNEVKKFSTENSDLDSNNILCIYESSEGIWIGASAPFRYDPELDKVVWYNKKGMYVKNRINIFFEDSGQNLWMGTTRVGVRKINYDPSLMTHFHSNQGEESIKSDEVLAFTEDNTGKIWVSLGGFGLSQFVNDGKNQRFIESESNPKLISRSIKTIYSDKLNNLWLGSWEGGLARYHPIQKQLKIFHPSLGNFPSQHVWAIESTDNENIWVGTLRDGLYLFSPAKERFQSFRHQDSDSASLINNDVLCLNRDSQNNLWIGTGNGLSIRLSGESNFENYFGIGSNLMKNMSSNVIYCLYEDDSKRVWLGTNGSGLIITELHGKELNVVKVLSTENGLPSNVINSFQPDGRGNIWVSTTNGLAMVDPKNASVLKISNNLSLSGVEFLTNSSLLTSDGKILFGSTTGFYSLNPGDNKTNQNKPLVYITGLKLLNKDASLGQDGSILTKSIHLTTEISIPPDINYYTFEFAALNYTQNEKNQYAYKLDGFDKDWNRIGTQRTASYTNLNPGQYTLLVIASNNDNLWNETGTALVINIIPPWYKTLWFRLGGVLMLAGLVFLFFRLRIQSIRALNIRLEKEVAQRTADLSMAYRELQQSKEEIASQNEELIQTQEEISSQRDFVADQNKEITEKSNQLEESHQKLKVQNELLEKLHREKDGTINIIAHDLRSPLKQIQGLTDLIKISGPVNEDQDKFLGLVKNVVTHGSTLINNLLELHGMDSTNIKQDIVPINLEEFIPALLGSYESNLLNKKQKIELALQPIKKFHTNKDYLQRILDNLLTNAMKFSNEGATITIRACQDESQVKISVKDQGPGISEEEQKQLFIPFKRLSARPTGGETSSGLGLSIVKLLTEKMQGSLTVNSQPGKGAEFIISLPLK